MDISGESSQRTYQSHQTEEMMQQEQAHLEPITRRMLDTMHTITQPTSRRITSCVHQDAYIEITPVYCCSFSLAHCWCGLLKYYPPNLWFIHLFLLSVPPFIYLDSLSFPISDSPYHFHNPDLACFHISNWPWGSAQLSPSNLNLQQCPQPNSRRYIIYAL